MTLGQLRKLLATEPPENDHLEVKVWLPGSTIRLGGLQDGGTLVRRDATLLIEGDIADNEVLNEPHETTPSETWAPWDTTESFNQQRWTNVYGNEVDLVKAAGFATRTNSEGHVEAFISEAKIYQLQERKTK